MKGLAPIALLAVAACGKSPGGPAVPAGGGSALEKAAVARGLVIDPGTVDPVGVFASESDKVCIRPEGDGYRIGASVDYGEGQACAATGSAKGRGTLAVTFGGNCKLEARIDGDRLRFPAVLPAACERLCTGRASLAALTADRLSASAAEAASAVGARGAPLCP